MSERDNWPRRRIFCILLAVCAACTSHTTHHAIPTDSPDAEHLLEMECESQLNYLETVISRYEASLPATDPVMIELTEIYTASQELFLKREYSLALSLIDTALQSIKEKDF